MAGTLTIDTLKASSGVLATQNGMTGIAKAWVNFNGSTAAIRSSFNVGSVTKNGTGDYTINFTTAMPDANYSWCGNCGNGSSNLTHITTGPITQAPTTTTFRMLTTNYAATIVDVTYVSFTATGN